MAFNPTSFIQAQQIAESSTTQRHPLGTRIRAFDPTYGEAEFIYLKGVASTAVGDVVGYDIKNATTTRAVTTTRGPLAVAMSANIANQYGWYCVYGAVPVNAAGATASVAIQLYMTATPGALDDAATAGSAVTGISFMDAVSGAGAFTAQLSYPHTQSVPT